MEKEKITITIRSQSQTSAKKVAEDILRLFMGDEYTIGFLKLTENKESVTLVLYEDKEVSK